MSGYDLSSQVPYRLMKGRLGVYEKKPFDPQKAPVEGVQQLNVRLGGNNQQERMIRDKRRTLDRAVLRSYQGAEVLREDAEYRKPVRALINPNKLKQDYDDKIISIGYEYNFNPGDVFEWIGTQTKWLIYLQDLTELAYFRGDIRRCNYEITWRTEDGEIHKIPVALKGPTETRIDARSQHGVSIDVPNRSLNVMMPRNEYALAYFDRYSKFYLAGDPTCWRVEATDTYSTPGILTIEAVEYYANETEDDTEIGLVGALAPERVDPNSMLNKISGETFIRPRQDFSYKYTGNEGAIWTAAKDSPVTLTIDTKNPRLVTVHWDATYSGQFELQYGDYASKIIVVESLF